MITTIITTMTMIIMTTIIMIIMITTIMIITMILTQDALIKIEINREENKIQINKQKTFE